MFFYLQINVFNIYEKDKRTDGQLTLATCVAR